MSRVKKGISDMPTAQKARLRSKPRMEGQRLLEMYLLTKERERLESHREVVDKKNTHVCEEIDKVEQEMQNLAGDSPIFDLVKETKKSKGKGRKDKKDRVKTNKMTLDY
ncbi:MAG: hypothetical protein KJ907_13635 [Actinobacteria bacterium]|nr:hypothetical protein [Actinomycetota bacterium]MBU4179476.1 hypothetical protein [Actinomycetota bacterium]MBU4403759.1 hypothetical protein [Actinomycetota bacterium]MCG2819314.1 hypothetical protein [Actinomycetes bacterium]